MTDDDEWAKQQMKPLGMFELADKWADAIKVIRAGNGAGIVAAGAALNTFSQRPDVLFWVKCGGVSFFVGVFTFALGFAFLHRAIFTYDEMLHAIRQQNPKTLQSNSLDTGVSMIVANNLAIISTLAFFAGLVLGLVAFLRY
jgi:uncharacterized membrane protein YidH (DUF202 family)